MYGKHTTPQVGDIVKHIYTKEILRVLEVNTKWGWFKLSGVRELRRTKRFSFPCQLLDPVTKEQFADYLLGLEKRGLTNFWREYD